MKCNKMYSLEYNVQLSIEFNTSCKLQEIVRPLSAKFLYIINFKLQNVIHTI